MKRPLLLVLLAVILLGCGSHPLTTAPGVAADFPAARWVPAKPTYVLASPTVKDAQRSVRDVVDSLGMLGGVDLGDVSRELQSLLAVDLLSADPVAAIGIDLDGGFVVFSEDVSPTFVVRLAAPDQLQAFFDRQRQRGLRTQSVVIDGTEVFSAQLVANAKVSWAVAGDWLWVHFSLPFTHDDATAWFTRSYRPGAPTWSTDWQWAREAAGKTKPALIGVINARDLIGRLVSRVPDAVACAKLVAPLGRVAISIDGDGHAASARLTLDVGAAAHGLTAARLPTPEGWAVATTKAPLAVQWNLDLTRVRGWLQPCAKAVGQDLGWLDEYGVRAARAMILSFDAEQKSGSGALSLDLDHGRWFKGRLDDLPGSSLRSTLERDRKYGPLAGHSLSIPFGPTVDYVLNDKVAFVAIGDRLLANLVGTGNGAQGPLASIDVRPPAMDAGDWEWILAHAVGRRAKLFVQRLMRWHDGHIAITVAGSSVVVEASGNRR